MLLTDAVVNDGLNHKDLKVAKIKRNNLKFSYNLFKKKFFFLKFKEIIYKIFIIQKLKFNNFYSLKLF